MSLGLTPSQTVGPFFSHALPWWAAALATAVAFGFGHAYQGARGVVVDRGCGIAPEHLPNLFQPFFSTKAEGMGMGLNICRSIMEAHGGRLWATATVPHGAMFQFTLPVNADTAS